jgi:glycogen phosphorylase
MFQDPVTSILQKLPESLQALYELAYNLRWTWDAPTRNLFARAMGDEADADSINPVVALLELTPDRILQLAADASFVDELNAVAKHFEDEVASTCTWFDSLSYSGPEPIVAYFSAEFGLTEHLPIYSGGLGVLAGDHLKSASVLGLPLVAISLFYYDGYFQQTIDPKGWQQDADVQSEPSRLPMRLVRDEGGEPRTVSVPILDRVVTAQIWQVSIGRIHLYLMDTRRPENTPEDQAISDRLYGGDQDLRLRQEIMLGIGGLRVLNALNIKPASFHLNEGHSSFLSLERIRETMQQRDVSFSEALAAITAGTIFTTHTPVSAGHDYFSAQRMQRYFGDFAAELGLEWEDFLSLGRADANAVGTPFGMTELAMRTSSARNGVSKLHGDVTRQMWNKLWPTLSENEVPVGHVTNGVDMATWIAPATADLLDQHIAADWRHTPTNFPDWQEIEEIPAGLLWQLHQQHKRRLVTDARERVRRQAARSGATTSELQAAAEVLDPDALTLGFARRFTAYKRATLLFSDLERLEALISDQDRPVQFIFSGKAHPRDTAGKQLIQRIASVSQREPFSGRVLFLEAYDMAIARHMVAGVDVWLNNPMRPQEASGTSGMKAAANGVLNFSILDGWWAEAWETAFERGQQIGWAIDPGYAFEDQAEQDAADAIRLYETLEQEIIPTFYNRDSDGIPVDWVALMKASMRCAIPDFSGVRMVSEYARDYYLPAAARSAISKSR